MLIHISALGFIDVEEDIKRHSISLTHSIEIISRFLVEGWDKTIYLFTTIRSGYLDIKAWLAGSGPEGRH